MKARIKATGEIVEVVITERETHTGEQVYMTDDGRLIEESRLELNVDDAPDYWTRLENQYAGMAMQGILANPAFWKMDWSNNDTLYVDLITMRARSHAHALVEKMKEERK